MGQQVYHSVLSPASCRSLTLWLFGHSLIPLPLIVFDACALTRKGCTRRLFNDKVTVPVGSALYCLASLMVSKHYWLGRQNVPSTC